MLDKLLIAHCSPTLSGMKTANLFLCSIPSDEGLCTMVAAWNRELNPKGVSLHILCKRNERALIYVYRRAMLAADLQVLGVQAFLTEFGYSDLAPEFCLERLKERFADSPGFPHEIGLFLGYPLGDVRGFIENGGQNYKLCGPWKVYCNECEALKLFTKYKKCREVYTKLFENRIRSVYQLTVAVS